MERCVYKYHIRYNKIEEKTELFQASVFLAQILGKIKKVQLEQKKKNIKFRTETCKLIRKLDYN